MIGPKKIVNKEDMEQIDCSFNKAGTEDIEAKKKEFMPEDGEDEDDLRHLGFKEDDDPIDFSSFDKKFDKFNNG